MSTPQDNEALVRLELRISQFLRYGVFLSAAFLAGGWLSQLAKTSERLHHLQNYEPVSLLVVIQNALNGGDYPLLSIILGLAILISLPILRVLLTALLFIKNKDWYLAGLAFFVFGVLCLSFFLGAEL